MSDTNDNTPIFRRLFDRVFPKTADFFGLLANQCVHVGHTVNLLVGFMESGDPEIGKQIKLNEHEGDNIKASNLHALNEAFSTPIDREDIYRAITARNVEHSRRTLVQQTGNDFWLNMRAAPSSRDRSVNAGRAGQQSLAWQ